MTNSLKDKILEIVDIVAVIGEHVALTRRGKDFVGLCPFHNDHRPSFSVSPSKQIFKCWSCGAGGDVIRFVELRERVDFKEALALLARRAGVEVQSSPEDRRAAQLRERIQAVVGWARDLFRHQLKTMPGGRAARDYALGRGLTPATIERFGLGYAVDDWTTLLHAAQRARVEDEVLRLAGLVTTNEAGRVYDRFRNRLIFPIADAQGRPVAFGGRTLGDDPAKYLNSPETVLFSKSRVLYAFDAARGAIEAEKAAIVVEGYLDAVMLHQAGFEHVVATLGTALTDAHARLLRPRADTLYLCFDADTAGVAATDRAVEVALRTQAAVRVVTVEGGKDPADCIQSGGAEAFATCLKRSVDALEFKWSQTLRAFGQGGPQARRAATEEYLQFVAGATLAGGIDPLQQNLLVGRLSDLLGVPPDAVFDLLAKARRTARRSAAQPRAAVVEDASAYEASIRGLPAGLATAMETVFGLLLTVPACWREVDNVPADAAAYSRTWQELYRVLLEVHDHVGEYSIGDVLAQCDDGAVCELIGRARARVGMVAEPRDDFAAARAALAAEQALLRAGSLQADLRAGGGDDAGVFQHLRDACGAQDAIVPAESRWNAAV